MFDAARARKAFAAGALALTVLGGASACGGSDNKSADEAPATLNTALQAHARGQYAAAIDDYNKVLKQDSSNKFAWYNLGAIAQVQNRPDEARNDYNKTLAIDPNYEPALFNLAIVTTASGDTKGATALYRRAVAANPSDASAHYNLGLLLRK